LDIKAHWIKYDPIRRGRKRRRTNARYQVTEGNNRDSLVDFLLAALMRDDVSSPDIVAKLLRGFNFDANTTVFFSAVERKTSR